MLAESFISRVHFLKYNAHAALGPVLWQQATIFSPSISRDWSSSFSRTKWGGAVLQKSYVRPISATMISRTISLSPGRTAMEEDDVEVDLKRKFPLPEVFLEFLKQNGVDPAVYDAAQDLPRYIRYWCSRSVQAATKSVFSRCHGTIPSRRLGPPISQSALCRVHVMHLSRSFSSPKRYILHSSCSSFVRLKPQSRSEISEIEEELGVKFSPLSWLPGFFSIPGDVQIAGTKAYQEGKIYGMDAASGAAVAALDISPGDNVLDLCAAPGAKLCMMADLLKDSGTLTATDISQSRLAVSRTMLLKYGLGSHCRLFLADGTTFSLLPLRDDLNGSLVPGVATAVHGRVLGEQAESHARPIDFTYVDSNIYGEWRARKTAKEKKAVKRLKYLKDALDRVGGRESELQYYGKLSGVVGMKVSDVFNNSCCGEAMDDGYDKVLVDAECTHDGSLKHIFKYEQWGWNTFERRFFNAERMTSIASLQLRLLSNGFRLLKVGGILVYSTCSFTVAQNEDVVKKFLSMHPNSELQKITAANLWPCKAGGLPYSVRFDPVVSNTSGLFIAKISRLRT